MEIGWNLRGKLGLHEHRRDEMSGGFPAVENSFQAVHPRRRI